MLFPFGYTGETIVTNNQRAAGEARPMKPHDVAQLLAKLGPIKRDVATGMSSIAMRHRLNVQSIQLAALVVELGAVEQLGDAAEAIRAAIAAHHRDDAVAACAAFELAAEGKPSPAPIAPEVGADVAPVAAAPQPAPIETPAPTPPANDNDYDPDRAHPVTVRAHDAAERDHVDGASCSEKQEQAASGLPSIAGRDPSPGWYGPFATADELGETLRAARARRGMSQQDVATAAGVGRRFVGELEGGKATSEIGRVFAVCRALQLSIVAVPV